LSHPFILMPKYEILVRGKAARQIKRVPAHYFRLVRQHIDGLAENLRPPDVLTHE